MTVPKRPIVGPVRVDGTSLRRSYVEPEPGQMIALGDIVEWDDHRWDVVGFDHLLPREPDGYLPTRLMLERIERPAGRRKKVTRAHADSRDCGLVGHQVLLPGLTLPTPAEEEVRGGGAERG